MRIGFISMFDGTFDNDGHPIDATTGLPDDHWHICDGTNGTPDLRDRFIVGSGNAYAIGNTGGEATHALTESEMPAHEHHGLMYIHQQVPKTVGLNEGSIGYSLSYKMNSGRGANELYVNSTGGNQPHENRPPYYALAFIKKIK